MFVYHKYHLAARLFPKSFKTKANGEALIKPTININAKAPAIPQKIRDRFHIAETPTPANPSECVTSLIPERSTLSAPTLGARSVTDSTI